MKLLTWLGRAFEAAGPILMFLYAIYFLEPGAEQTLLLIGPLLFWELRKITTRLGHLENLNKIDRILERMVQIQIKLEGVIEAVRNEREEF